MNEKDRELYLTHFLPPDSTGPEPSSIDRIIVASDDYEYEEDLEEDNVENEEEGSHRGREGTESGVWAVPVVGV